MQRVRGQRRATSNPTSPVSESRQSYTSPEEIALVHEAIEAEIVVVHGSKEHYAHSVGHSTGSTPHGSIDRLDRDRGVEAVVTIPRKQRRHIRDAESVFNQQRSIENNPRQPSISHYDSIPARRHPRSVETTCIKSQQNYSDDGPWEPQRPQTREQQHRQSQLIKQRSNDYVDPRTIRRQRSQDGGLEHQSSYESSQTLASNYADPSQIRQHDSRDNYVDPQILRKQQQLRHQQKHHPQPGEQITTVSIVEPFKQIK